MPSKMECLNFASFWQKVKPKTPPRRPKTPQEAPRDALKSPRHLQDAPRRSQDTSQNVPGILLKSKFSYQNDLIVFNIDFCGFWIDFWLFFDGFGIEF